MKSYNYLPLDYAIYQVNLRAFEFLIYYETCFNSDSYLHFASEHGLIQPMEYIVSCGTDINQKDPQVRSLDS